MTKIDIYDNSINTNQMIISSHLNKFYSTDGPTTPDTYCTLDNTPLIHLNITGQTVYVVQREILSLKCFANGDPQPKYFWNGIDGDKNWIDGDKITVNITKDEVYNCVAKNSLTPDYGNPMSKSISTAVYVNRLCEYN